MNTLWYLPLESLKSRYTQQLCQEWMPNAIRQACPDIGWDAVVVEGYATADDVVVGEVLDATGRGIYALSQVERLLRHIRAAHFKTGDVLFLQDFWTPGIEAVFYALDQMNIQVKVFTENWAQSVDEFDFTHKMLPWIRHYELGLDARLTGTFVGSEVHRQQLRAAGFRSPIYVTSLPFDYTTVRSQYVHLRKTSAERHDAVMFCSRLDKEKNPFFMLEVAERFLQKYPSAEWWVTTSSEGFRSNQKDVVACLNFLANTNHRFKLFPGLTKEQYYERLGSAKVQFNCSLQDYVSWTLLEAVTMGCDIAYPDFRSFPECVPLSRRYRAFDVDNALSTIELAWRIPHTHDEIALLSDKGRRLQAEILFGREVSPNCNIWTQTL